MCYYFLFEKEFSMIKDLFIDRKKHLEELANGLKHGKDYILIAPRRFGKTTLAHEILNKIANDSKFIVVSIDFMRYSGSVQSIAEAIIENTLNALGIVGKIKLWIQQIEFSLKIKMKYADLEIEPMIQMIKNKNNEWALLEHALEFLETAAIKSNKHVVVFFDEFGELHSADERIIKTFRSILQLHKHVSCLFAGSQETLMAKIFVDQSGIFYRFGNLVWLKEFERGEVIELLEGMKLNFTTIDTIINTFNCHPYYTSRIIKDIMLQPIYGTSVENLENYINQVLIPEENAYLELQTEKIKARSNALDIFTNIALGIDPYSLGLSKQVVYNVLKNLELSGFIRKLDKSKYMVTDPLLKLYFS